MTGLLGYRPNLVVSGINNGANMGDDTIYSGTVGAAMEGFCLACPPLPSRRWSATGELQSAAQKARQIVQQMMQQQLIGASPWLLNVNIPNLPLEQMGQVKLCRLGRRHSAEPVITQVNPRGETMYWIGSAGAAKDDSEGTDFHATAHGHVSMTPLKVDLTDHDHLVYWAQTASRLDTAMQGVQKQEMA